MREQLRSDLWTLGMKLACEGQAVDLEIEALLERLEVLKEKAAHLHKAAADIRAAAGILGDLDNSTE